MKKTMKFLAMAFVVALTLGITGCQKDNEDLIIGKWNVLDMISTTTISGMGSEYDGVVTDTVTYKEGEASFTFNEDNTVVAYSIEENGEPSIENGTYTLNDNSLILTLDDQSAEMTIVKLNKKEMTLNGSSNREQGGVSIAVSVDLHFKKA